ncbi:MAG: acyl-ACP--UDP-N-acetylglucosamine O-acyltransferase [Victivallales bacterium]|nr:acyl-ACP--UDP-N-acetylglucosamine O-acyltransferase [Victivallales bacterium]
MGSSIHPTAIIDSGAQLGENVTVGPYAIIEDHTIIGDGCSIDAHVKIARYTTLGPRCRVYFGALVGEEPQDHRWKDGIVSFTEIGADTVIREYVTIHRSPFEGKKTVIGDGVLLMAFVHAGHDVMIGNRVTIANQTALSGHVEIGDGAIISGFVKMHQFCRIGTLAMISANNVLVQDVPPYCLMEKNGYIVGPNTIGLRRAGFGNEQRAAIRHAVKLFFFNGLNAKNAVREIMAGTVTPEVANFVRFVTSTSRGIISGNPDTIFDAKEDKA